MHTTEAMRTMQQMQRTQCMQQRTQHMQQKATNALDVTQQCNT